MLTKKPGLVAANPDSEKSNEATFGILLQCLKSKQYKFMKILNWFPDRRRLGLSKIILYMKITTLLLFVSIMTISASSFAQQARISLKVDNANIFEIFEELEEKTDIGFIFTANQLDVNKLYSIKKTNATLMDILDDILKDAPIGYRIVDNTVIIIDKGLDSQDDSQQKAIVVKGIVKDTKGEPIPGVNVIQKGNTQNGTITSIDGEFTLTLSGAEDVMMFSFIGFEKQEIEVGSRTFFEITLMEESIGLDEVVAVGYGVQKRSSVTGSISSIKAEELPTVANISVTNMLSGKASGVMIQQNSAQPGGGLNVVIRGAGSLEAGNEPLYVIDGFPVNNNSVEPDGGKYDFGSRNPLNSLNPNDIESIEVLKDASSTAIYGARAANGVILITTKRGKEGKTQVEFSTSQTVQKISKYFDMLDAEGFMTQSNVIGKERYYIDNGLYPYGIKDPAMTAAYVPLYTQEQIDNAGRGTDWWDEVTRTGLINEYNLSISGGSKNTTYMTSVNYFNQKGVVVNSDFKRFTARMNIEQKINDFMKVGVSATGSQIDNSNVQLGDGQFENSGVLMSALVASPLVPIYDAYGEYKINPNNAVLPNPYSFREIDDNTLSKRLMANAYFQMEPLAGLITKVQVGIDDKSAKRGSHLPKTFLYGAQDQSLVRLATNQSTDYLFNATVNYLKTISERHELNFLLGYEYQQFLNDGFGTSNNKFFTDAMGTSNIGIAEGTAVSNSYESERALASYFGRVSYSLDQRYIATFTLRRDGTTNFGENNKWGWFPSAALAWRVIQEPFMESVPAVSNLKLRLAYGQTGNSGIGTRAFEFYNTKGYYIFGNNPNTAVGKTQLANPDLKWETTTEFNIGLDFGFLNNRISGSVEYFDRIVSDLLANRKLPTYSDVRKIADNIGATETKGVELEVVTRNIDKLFKWTTNFNVSSYTDRWKERDPEVILNPWQGENDPIRPIYGFVSDGIVQVGQDIPHMVDELPGNVIYKDLNGFDEQGNLTGMPDGKIDDADKVLLASEDPGLMFGIGNTFEYKGFDLNIFFYGMADRTLRNTNRFKFMYDGTRLINGENNQMVDIDKIWTMDNQSTEHPGLAPQAEGGINTSDFLLEKADFLRLRNITLGYRLPKKWFSNKLDIRAYVDAQNLWTLTNYSGIDPETDSLGAYPNQKSFSVGLNVKF